MNINIICNALIHILILILLFVIFMNNKNDSNCIIFVLAAIVIFICYLLELVRRNQPDNNLGESILNLNNNIDNEKSMPDIEHFQASVDSNKIGPYDGLKLENKKGVYKLEEKYQDADCKWRKKPCNVGLYSNVGRVTPTGLEIEYKPDPSHNPTLPSVTGNKNDPKAMFMFSFNQSHPDCCPSTFSTSTGCVCTTQEQRDFINKRGGNRNKDIYPAI